MTLNAIINKLLKPLANDHLMLNGFGFGDLSNYAKTNAITYPVMWAVLNDASYRNKGFNYSFSLVFADVLKDDLSNTLEVQSNMIGIAADVAAKLMYSENENIEVSGDFVFKPFTERFTDLTAGVVMDINIKSLTVISDCDFPSNEDFGTPHLTTESNENLVQQNGHFINL